jgi:hypothetical protein
MARCANKCMYGKCKNQQNCLEDGTEKCFKPYPPRMTGDEFAAAQKEILEDIPEEFQGTLSYMAYESGHSAGYEEVINYLRGLVSDLEGPIKLFEKHIRLDIS